MPKNELDLVHTKVMGSGGGGTNLIRVHASTNLIVGAVLVSVLCVGVGYIQT